MSAKAAEAGMSSLSTSPSGSSAAGAAAVNVSGLTAAERKRLESELDPEDAERLEELPAHAERSRGVRRQPSTSFSPLPAEGYGRGQASAATEKQLEEGYAGGLGAQRVFSRREQPSHQDDAHMFGGDLQRAETEIALTRFASQAGKDQIIVHWEGEDDSENPKNWSRAYRWYLTGLSGFLVLNSTFTSSAPSGIIPQLIEDLQMTQEVATLSLAIFIAGYCLGPIIWGPLSERKGRYICFVVALFAYTGFNVGCALARNTGTLLVMRFLAGAFASSPLTTSGGVIADIWDAKTRGLALALFSLAPFAGPALGPLIAGIIAVRDIDWRWLFWICAIFSGACLVVTAVTLPETHAPTILKHKAQRIRKETGSDKYKAPIEIAKINPKDLLKVTLLKPFIMLVQEPMLLALTLYMSFVYGIIYLLFEAFPFVFEGVYGFNSLQSGLVFLTLFVGGCLGTFSYAIFENPRYVRLVDASKTGRVAPEQRLYIVMLAAPLLAISFFWFGWTSYASINYWAPLMAGVLIGFVVIFLFLGIFNFIVDAYLANAASALAANTVCRSAFGAGFPLFAFQMYEKLNQHWASTLLGCLAVIMVPIPFVLFKYGPKLRAMSKHASTH